MLPSSLSPSLSALRTGGNGHLIAFPGSAFDSYMRPGFKPFSFSVQSSPVQQEEAREEGEEDTNQTGGGTQENLPGSSPYFPTSTLDVSPAPPPSSFSRSHHEPECEDTEDQGEAETFSKNEDHPVMSQSDLRTYILTHSLKGTKMPKERSKFIGEVTPFTSPVDKEVSFGLRRFDNAAILKYRDLDAAVRYTYQEGDDKVTTEKDYPMGTRRLDVVMLGLVSWNITDNGQAIPITRENVLAYLDPEGELDAVYEKIMELNPVLTGQARKNS